MYYVGNYNKEILRTIDEQMRSSFSNISKCSNSTLIYGVEGIGKSSLCRYIEEKYNKKVIKRISAIEFCCEMIASLKSREMFKFRENYKNSYDCLIIENLDEIENKEATQKEILEIFRFFRENGKIVITTACAKKLSETNLDRKLVTYFDEGNIFVLNGPDDKDKLEILKSYERTMNIGISADLLKYLASRCYQNVSQVKGAYIEAIKIKAMSELEI